MQNENDYLYKDLNYEINGCAFDAFKEVGVGFDEPRYHKFFHQNLLDKGLKAKYKVPLQAFYRNQKIADFEADEIVEDCIVVEAKAIQSDFIPENYAQLFTYLKLTKLKLGLLVNFGLIKAKSKRVQVDPMEIDFWLVDGAFLLAILAGKDDMRKYDIYRMRSYLKHLKLNRGLIAYWNVKKLQLYGIYQP
jgi:GxxExxY protein